MVDISQTDKGDLELVGQSVRGVGFLPSAVEYDPATQSVRQFMTAARSFRVKSITGRVTAAGTDGGAVTGSIYKVPSGTAMASGTLLHTGTFNFKGTANTNQTLTLSATDTAMNIIAGDTIGMVITGVMTSAIGSITVTLTPA